MDAGTNGSEPSLDRYSFYSRALKSLDGRYIPGFWTWLKEERPEQYELINYDQEIIHEESKSGTDASFRRSTKRWWGRVAAELTNYGEDQEAQAVYKSFL